MTGAAPSAWSAWDAVAACPREAYRGTAWRAHHQDYAAISWDGSLHSSGRYNRGPVEFPGERTWPALYLALRPEICWPEITRHSPVTPRHNHFLLTTLQIHLFRVVIARDPVRLGIPVAALLQDQPPTGTGYDVSQRLALAALEHGRASLCFPTISWTPRRSCR